MSTKLDSRTVADLFEKTLAENENSDSVTAEGIVRNAAFDPSRLEEAKPAIREMLDQLPSEFRMSGGGGWSFLNACIDNKGRQWTGEHRVMEMLFLLGIAAGMVKCLLPRDIWSVMPGGMPYYGILNDEPKGA